VALQRMFASAMLAADPVASGVYYVDDHFVPYTGAKPVAKGWNNKRGRAERGRADTHVTAHDGRAVCFVTGEPSGLSTTLPRALAELKKAAGPGTRIMLGFDRGGACPQMVLRLHAHNAEHWLSGHLNAYLCDDDEYRAITRQTIIRGLAGTITWAPAAITVQLDQPGSARIARALALLIQEINATPPAMPGDSGWLARTAALNPWPAASAASPSPGPGRGQAL
jgi:hypothetical protein